jgi:hypothetical protein
VLLPCVALPPSKLRRPPLTSFTPPRRTASGSIIGVGTPAERLLSARRGGARASVDGTRHVLVRSKNSVTPSAAALVAAAAASRSLLPNTWRLLHTNVPPELLAALQRALGARQGVAQQVPLGAPPLKPAALLAHTPGLPLLVARPVPEDNPAAKTPAPHNYGVFTANEAVPPYAIVCEYRCAFRAPASDAGSRMWGHRHIVCACVRSFCACC